MSLHVLHLFIIFPIFHMSQPPDRIRSFLVPRRSATCCVPTWSRPSCRCCCSSSARPQRPGATRRGRGRGRCWPWWSPVMCTCCGCHLETLENWWWKLWLNWGSMEKKTMKHDTHDKHGEFEMTQQDLTPEIGI